MNETAERSLQPEGRGVTIETYTGRFFSLNNPRAEDVDIIDIAVSLSRKARFGGHTLRSYTVAQHSVFVSHHCDPAYALDALLHDAAEAYTGDISAPMKLILGPGLALLEEIIHMAIAERFGLARSIPRHVWLVDKRACATEQRDLRRPASGITPGYEPFDGPRIVAWPSYRPVREFLTRFEELANVRLNWTLLPDDRWPDVTSLDLVRSALEFDRAARETYGLRDRAIISREIGEPLLDKMQRELDLLRGALEPAR